MYLIIDEKLVSKVDISLSRQFIMETIIEIARQYPADGFMCLTHEKKPVISDLPSNIAFHYIKKGILKWLNVKWWYKYQLPQILSKLPPGLYITLDNHYIRNGGLPTCLFLTDSLSLLKQQAYKRIARSGRSLLQSIKRSTVTITFSEHLGDLLKKQGLPEGKIKFLKLAASSKIEPLTWTDKEIVKVKYAEGCEYFLYSGDVDPHTDLLDLLKAFSQFKKRQQSNMKLIFAVNTTALTIKFQEKLATFKFRDDVHIVRNCTAQQRDELLGAAYAVVCPARLEYFPINILRAMKAGVPVIASEIPVIKVVAGDAVIYPDSNDEGGFAKALQLLYKDENLRSRIITAGKIHLEAAGKADFIHDCRNIFDATFTSK
ncbi:MAG: glycosyltransferase [Chitinophagaceae bacterium]